MRQISHLLAPLLIVLVACDKIDGRSKEFGVSYDDCILKNKTTGTSDVATATVDRACRRIWERDTSAPAEVSAKLHNDTNPHMEFAIRNGTKDIVTKVQIAVSFYKSDEDAFDAELKGTQAKSGSKLTWTLPVFLGPGEETTINGSFGEGGMPSAAIAVIPEETKFLKALPIVKARTNG